MVLTSHRPKARDRALTQAAASLLAELKQAHDTLGQSMAELDRMTREPVADKTRFADVRWRISRASLTRRLLWARILGFLIDRAGEQPAAELRRLQDRDIELLRASIRHVAQWTTPAALARWPHYCAASRGMRARMTEALEAEQRILYPMLEEASQGNDFDKPVQPIP